MQRIRLQNASWKGLTLIAAVLAAGCATNSNPLGSGIDVTASDPSHLTQSGFLSDYGRLAPVPWDKGVQCWRRPDLDIKRYNKVLIARMSVSLKPAQQTTIDPTDLKTLTDYFHASMVKALKPQMKVVEKPGPGVLGLRIALTNLVPTSVTRSVTGTLIPYGFVLEAGSGLATGRPAGSTPYLGETSIEMQLVDSVKGTILAECRDTQIGRKYAAEMDAGATGAAQTWASGYVNSFQSWAYAKNAFDKWSALTAERLAALRGTGG
ncbi:DUF3313 domain-containing protein [Allochromatium palmeri]|uniref:DUF3313 family protein n=1 Tax=Allochromatium palmeri TaxID=231048 RepID=A0A6N8EF74_9GAMM|nr:DUF3313 domain-containing protein [Allochromatium palmeri]MTW21728.1 DUF3313 family protein [Allochromatium palmeri]